MITVTSIQRPTREPTTCMDGILENSKEVVSEMDTKSKVLYCESSRYSIS